MVTDEQEMGHRVLQASTWYQVISTQKLSFDHGFGAEMSLSEKVWDELSGLETFCEC
jgi:hypothetical protein